MQNFGLALVILRSEPWKGSGNVGAEPSVRLGLIRQGGVSKVADLIRCCLFRVEWDQLAHGQS